MDDMLVVGVALAAVVALVVVILIRNRAITRKVEVEGDVDAPQAEGREAGTQQLRRQGRGVMRRRQGGRAAQTEPERGHQQPPPPQQQQQQRQQQQAAPLVIGDDDFGMAPAEDDEAGEMEELIALGQRPDNISVKKWKKMVAKYEKKREREALVRQVQEKQAREEQRLEQVRERERQYEEEERLRLEEEAKEEAERKRKEQEEYDALKSMFVVEDAGSKAEEQEQEAQGLLVAFVDYIKKNKVVNLEDLATEFGLKTADAIQRVKDLEAAGTLTGVTDDRGKYIYITQEELEGVAKFMRQRGRVSISELAENSHTLIDLK